MCTRHIEMTIETDDDPRCRLCAIHKVATELLSVEEILWDEGVPRVAGRLIRTGCNGGCKGETGGRRCAYAIVYGMTDRAADATLMETKTAEEREEWENWMLGGLGKGRRRFEMTMKTRDDAMCRVCLPHKMSQCLLEFEDSLWLGNQLGGREVSRKLVSERCYSETGEMNCDIHIIAAHTDMTAKGEWWDTEAETHVQ